MTNAEQLWRSCAEALQDHVSDATWKTWFEGITPVSAADGYLRLAVPSALVKERLEGRYLPLLEHAASVAAGEAVAIAVDVQTESRGPLVAVADSHDDDGRPISDGQGNALPTLTPPAEAYSIRPDPPLNIRYTFDTFVIGTSNRFAHAAALSVAETPAKSYNPLFVHGGAGLGKTHLLQAIGNYVRQHFPARPVRYVTTETFTNEFIDAIRANTKPAFKRRYRDCGVLLVDDIQFLENKEGTQEEFFHTFNAIYEAGGQIVITSDRHPKALETLADRLRSRFLSGLITDVQPPDLETRLAILHKKATFDEAKVPDDVLEFIAVHIKNNIRELEGALLRVSAYASLYQEPATRQLAERVLADIVSADEPRPITPNVILQTTADTFGFTKEELCGPSRRRPLVIARQICMYVFRELTDFSYPAIAREFGGRDHTTVIHAVEKISTQMRERRQIYDQVSELMHRIKKGV